MISCNLKYKIFATLIQKSSFFDKVCISKTQISKRFKISTNTFSEVENIQKIFCKFETTTLKSFWRRKIQSESSRSLLEVLNFILKIVSR